MNLSEKQNVLIHNMAWRRGLAILKARRGGWYITLIGNGILYCTHDWKRVELFVKKFPILVSRRDIAN